MTQDINSIINIIERSSESYSTPVYIPSLKKEVNFREISTAQHKRILKSTIDDPVYNSLFIKTMYSIIKENCVGDVDFNKLTIIDKMFIILHLRSVSIGDTISVELQSKNDESSTYKSDFKITNVIKNAKKVVKNIEPETLEIGPYKIHCSVPNILTECKIEEELRNDEIGDMNTAEDIRETFAEKFISEICKFINKIEIVKDEAVDVNLEEYSFKDRITLIEKLPSNVAEAVVKYMGKVNSEIEKVTILNKNVTINEQKEEFSYQLSLDATFFTGF